MNKLRTLFTPSTGSRARTIVRAVIPVLVLFGVIDWTPEQIAAVLVAVEAVFAGGGEVSKRV